MTRIYIALATCSPSFGKILRQESHPASALGLHPAGPDRACRSTRVPRPLRRNFRCAGPPTACSGGSHEADISAEQSQKVKDARLSPSDVDARWPGHHSGPPSPRTPPPVGIERLSAAGGMG